MKYVALAFALVAFGATPILAQEHRDRDAWVIARGHHVLAGPFHDLRECERELHERRQRHAECRREQ